MRIVFEIDDALTEKVWELATASQMSIPEYARRALRFQTTLPERTRLVAALVDFGMPDSEVAATVQTDNGTVKRIRLVLGLFANRRRGRKPRVSIYS